MQPTPFLASLAVLIGASLWGLYWIPVRYFDGLGIEGILVVALLNLPAGIVSALWVAATWRAQRPFLHQALLIGTFAGIAIGFYGVSILLTTVVRATLLFYLMPVWATLMGLLWLNEPAGLQRWVAIALGLCGLALLMLGSDEAALSLGDGLALISGFAWAITAVLLKRTGKAPFAGMIAVQFLSTGMVAMILGLGLGEITQSDIRIPYEAILLVIAISLLGVLPAIAMIFWASQFLFPGRVGILLMAEAVVAIVSAALYLPEEAQSLAQWAAVALIIGAAIVELMGNKTNLGPFEPKV